MRKKVFVAISACFLLMAFYHAWEDQRIAVRSAQDESNKRGEALDNLQRPHFSLTIESAYVARRPDGGSEAYLICRLKNTGARSAVTAASWSLDVLTNDGLHHAGRPSMFNAGNNDFCMAGGQALVRFVSKDALDYKAARGIERNGYELGVLNFIFLDLSQAALEDDHNVLTAAARDMNDVESTTSTTMGAIRSRHGMVFRPELTFPAPIHAACQNASSVAH